MDQVLASSRKVETESKVHSVCLQVLNLGKENLIQEKIQSLAYKIAT